MTISFNNRMETRNNCSVPVESKNDSSFGQTRTVDISRHGIGFISPYPHKVNEKVAIGIQLKPNKDPVLVIGIVKWVNSLSDSSGYRIGMRYDESFLDSQRRLEHYFE
ncbi:MAG: PilZ domain-containing protein [Candidatus Omnitrophica bacterium]|nr:PilZ domain-containing protein [Candidatus Omnitrophota bacterium]